MCREDNCRKCRTTRSENTISKSEMSDEGHSLSNTEESTITVVIAAIQSSTQENMETQSYSKFLVLLPIKILEADSTTATFRIAAFEQYRGLTIANQHLGKKVVARGRR